MIVDALEERQLLSTWYVGQSGDADNASHGTSPSAPFQTIQYALTQMASGDTLDIEGGTYALGTGGNNTGGIDLGKGLGGVTLAHNLTITAYNSTPVYIVGGEQLTSTWTSVGSGIYKTTFTGDIEQVFDNFNASHTTSQTPLVQIGAGDGVSDSNRIEVSGSPTTIAAGQFYDDYSSNTLYVHLSSGAAPTSGEITVNNPSVSELMYYNSITPSGDNISHLNFEMSTSEGTSNTTTTLGGAVRVPPSSTLHDCNIYWAAFAGVEVDSAGVTVSGCNVYDAGCAGMLIDSTGWTIQHCDIEYNNYRAFDVTWGAGGMKIIPNAAGDVIENQVANNRGSGIWCDTDLGGSGDVITIEENYVHDNVPVAADYDNTGGTSGAPFVWGEAGIKVEVSEYVNVENNIVTKNSPNGILVAGSSHTNVLNNTVTNNFGEAAIAMTTDGERYMPSPHNLNAVTTYNTFYNNIIAHNSTTYDLMMAAPQPTSHPSVSDPSGPSSVWVSNNVSDYNIFYRPGEPIQNTLGNPDDDDDYSGTSTTVMGAVQTTLAGWQSVSGQDAHSKVIDPEFYSSSGSWSYSQSTDVYSSGDLDPLGSNSPAINAGTNAISLSHNYDYLGVANTRSGTYDIGAREYASGDPAGSPYAAPATDAGAWVDDTLPTGATILETLHSLNNGGGAVTARTTMFNWANIYEPQGLYNWISGGTPESGAESIVETDAPAVTGWEVSQFSGATQTMAVSSGDMVYFYVYLANGSDTTTAPDDFSISFQSSSGWQTYYWGPTTSGSENIQSDLNKAYDDTATHVSSTLPTAGTWVELTLPTGTYTALAGKSFTGLSLATYGGEVAFDDIGDDPATAPGISNLAATSPNASEVDLSWTYDYPNDGTAFEIERSTNGTTFSNYTSVPITQTYFDDTGLTTGSYYYKVYVVANAGMTNSAVSGAVPGVTGLVGSWEMENGSGTVVSDSSGYGNNGTIEGTGVTWTTSGKVGDALSFNGTTGSYVSVADSSSLDLSSGISIGAWVDQTTTTTGYHIDSGIDKNGSYGLIATTIGSTTKWEFYITDSTGVTHTAIETTGTTNGAWHYILGTWGGATIKLWVDGVTVASTTWSGTIMNSSSSLDIGLGQGTYPFDGLIDEVAVVNRGYTTTEIADNYSLGNSGIHSDVETGGDSPLSGGSSAAPMASSQGSANSSTAESALFSESQIDEILDYQS